MSSSQEPILSTTYGAPFNIRRCLLWAVVPFIMDINLFAAVGMGGTELEKIWPNLSGESAMAATVILISSSFYFLVYILAIKRDEVIGLLCGTLATVFMVVLYFWGFQWVS